MCVSSGDAFALLSSSINDGGRPDATGTITTCFQGDLLKLNANIESLLRCHLPSCFQSLSQDAPCLRCLAPLQQQ